METLIYDGDCAFCQRALDVGRRLGVDTPAQAWQLTDLAAVGLTQADVLDAVWYVDGNRRWRGHEAVARAMLDSRFLPVRLLGGLGRAWILGLVLGPAYAWVARHRHELPGGTAACKVPGPDARQSIS